VGDFSCRHGPRWGWMRVYDFCSASQLSRNNADTFREGVGCRLHRFPRVKPRNECLNPRTDVSQSKRVVLPPEAHVFLSKPRVNVRNRCEIGQGRVFFVRALCFSVRARCFFSEPHEKVQNTGFFAPGWGNHPGATRTRFVTGGDGLAV